MDLYNNANHDLPLPPTLLLTTLKKERDSLQMALTAELNHRRKLEDEIEDMRRRMLKHERELMDVKKDRERVD